MTEAKVYPEYEGQEWDKHYQFLYEDRLKTIHKQEHTSASLQECHEAIIQKALCLAIKKTESEWGQPPTHFAFFLMGSGGRREQSFWSDQDHGLVFDSDEEQDEHYFLQLGKEIVFALDKVGYKLCEGKVMASSPKWCKSLQDWKQQINKWLKDDTWESLRFTLTFVDSRSVYGKEELLDDLKKTFFQAVEANPSLLGRLTENTGRLKKGIGLFNQLLVETKGKHKGQFDFKQIVLFPYVNALRLLAIEQQIYESSTLSRFQLLPEKYNEVKRVQRLFEEMLEMRLIWHRNTKNYEDIHHLNVKELSQLERRQIKQWVREGHKLYQLIEGNLKKGGSA